MTIEELKTSVIKMAAVTIMASIFALVSALFNSI